MACTEKGSAAPHRRVEFLRDVAPEPRGGGCAPGGAFAGPRASGKLCSSNKTATRYGEEKMTRLKAPSGPDLPGGAPCPAAGNAALALAALIAGLGLCASAAAQDAAQDAAAPAPAETAAAAPVPEPSTSSGTLQEIVITATRHSEAMSKVPVSVSAMSQESMDIKGVKDFTDVARYTPGVAIDANGTNNISIRGISSSGGSGTTGIYIDDSPIQMRALGFNADDTLPKTFDLDRVEVLRGPQGTLFGAGSEGGTVRYIMTQPNMSKPSMYARGELSFTQGGGPSYEAGVAYGAPIVENELGFRASVWYRHDGGWIDQIDPFTLQTVQSDTNYANDVVVRLAAKWAVNESLSISPSILYQDRNTNNVTAFWPIYSNPGSNSYKNADPDIRPEPDHYYLPAVKIESDVGSNATLISNTSYFQRKDLSGYNGTEYNLGYYQTFSEDPAGPTAATPFNGNYYPLIDGNGLHLPASLQNYRAPATVTNQQGNFTQEIRLQSNDQADSRFVWTTGLFFSTNRQISVEQINDPMMYQLFQGLFNISGFNASGCPFSPGASGSVLYEETVYCANGASVLEPLMYSQSYYLMQLGDSYYNYNFSRDKQTAIFGETTIGVTDKLKGIIGLRYAWTNVDFNHIADGPQNFIGANPGSGTLSDRPFTPKLGVSYQADRDDLFYATWAKGFRIGGANPPIPTAACLPDLTNIGIPGGAPDSYKSDTVRSFEVGSKNNFHDRLRLASSLYYIKWDGIQQNIYLPGCGFQFTANVGQALAKGGDLQIEWAPAAAFELEAAIGYTDARFTANGELAPGAPYPIVAAGDAVTGESGVPTAPWTATLGGQYNFVAAAHKSFVRFDWELQKHSDLLTPAEDNATSQFAYGFAYNPASTSFVSVRAGTEVDKSWNVSAFVDNLFDSHPAFPPSSYAYSDVDEYNPNFVKQVHAGGSALIREYTFRPRTLGLTTTYRF
jgi:outer membrane receptor protein involved in Fe transport